MTGKIQELQMKTKLYRESSIQFEIRFHARGQIEPVHQKRIRITSYLQVQLPEASSHLIRPDSFLAHFFFLASNSERRRWRTKELHESQIKWIFNPDPGGNSAHLNQPSSMRAGPTNDSRTHVCHINSREERAFWFLEQNFLISLQKYGLRWW